MKKLNYEHYFQINMKTNLIKVSLKKTLKTSLIKVSSFQLKISFKTLISKIKLLNEIMIYDNEKITKTFI